MLAGRDALCAELSVGGKAHPIVAALGKVRLPELTGIPELGWFALLVVMAGAVFWFLETRLAKPTEP